MQPPATLPSRPPPVLHCWQPLLQRVLWRKHPVVLDITTAIDAIQSQRFIVDSFRTSPATKTISAAQSFLCIGDQLSKSMRTHHRTPVVSAGRFVRMQRIVTTGPKIPN
jgi:hypothetical protein